jgi:hypothetical protein
MIFDKGQVQFQIRNLEFRIWIQILQKFRIVADPDPQQWFPTPPHYKRSGANFFFPTSIYLSIYLLGGIFWFCNGGGTLHAKHYTVGKANSELTTMSG